MPKAAKKTDAKDLKTSSTGSVLLGPRVTEKATTGTGQNVYTFKLDPRANKITVKAVIKATYKVAPVKVNIVNLPAKKVFRRGKVGRVAGLKKALVYLKPGDKIDFV